MTPLGWLVIPMLLVGIALLITAALHALGIPSWVAWAVALLVFAATRSDR